MAGMNGVLRVCVCTNLSSQSGRFNPHKQCAYSEFLKHPRSLSSTQSNSSGTIVAGALKAAAFVRARVLFCVFVRCSEGDPITTTFPHPKQIPGTWYQTHAKNFTEAHTVHLHVPGTKGTHVFAIFNVRQPQDFK